MVVMLAVQRVLNNLSSIGVATLLLVVARWPLPVCANQVATLRLALAEDRRSFSLTTPGLAEFKAGWSATIERDGVPHVLSSSAGEVNGTTIRFADDGVELLFRFEQPPNVAAVLAQAGIRNTGSAPVKLVSVTPVSAQFQVTGSLEEWLVTGLHPKTRMTETLKVPRDIHEYGGFYRPNGVGFLFGPVGEPVAYVNARMASNAPCGVTFDFVADMSGVSVDPGETRWGQQVALVMEQPRAALVRWTEWVAASHGARTAKGALTGWSNRYSLLSNATGKDIQDIVDAVTMSEERLRPDVIELDECQPSKFPEGFADYAQRIAATGARPGWKLDLFCGQADWLESVRNQIATGFTFLKIDLHRKSPVSGKQTSFEMERQVWRQIREVAGDGVYLSNYFSFPDRATVGAVDAGRIGYQPRRERLRSCVEIMLRSVHLNRRWYATDFDVYYMATELRDVNPVVGGWPMARTWISMVGLSSGTAFTSDLWNQDKFKPYWRNVEVLTPPAKEEAEVLDLCTSQEWPRLVGQVRRDWGNTTVALLWNPGDTEQAVTLDFAAAGMDARHRYAVWSFWDDRYLGVAQGKWITPRLAASASQHLVFTDLKQSSQKPVLIGSNLHIWCGAAEIKQVHSSRTAMSIELTDAGARAGDLYVYSRYQPVLKTATGCAVTGVGSAGENVWRVSLRDRQHGAPQRIKLAIMLPVTQQIWFWLLIAGFVASVMVAVWRYMASLRLQRVYALEQERARIARDMHDEVGGKLARLSMVGEMALGETAAGADGRPAVEEITRGVREVAGELEQIIWSLNPQHDTLEALVHRIFQFAEEYFTGTPVQCRFEPLPDLPTMPMQSDMRAGVFGAFKEALANVLKHSGATSVNISARRDGGVLEIQVVDNGHGFDPANAKPVTGGNGLTNMRTRMEQIGGTCQIESRPGQTTVTLRWPLDKTTVKG